MPLEKEPGQLGALLRRLVALHVEPSRLEDVLQIATRLLDSALATAPSMQTVDTLNRSMLFRLVREGRHEEATRLAALAAGLKFEHGIKQEAIWPVLYVLNAMRGSASELPMEQSGIASSSNKASAGKSVRDNSELSAVAREAASSETSRAGESTRNVNTLPFISSKPFEAGEDSVTQPDHKESENSAEEEEEVKQPLQAIHSQNGSLGAPVSSIQTQAMEKRLIEEVLLLVQGESGKIISFVGEQGEETVQLDLPTGVELPLPVKDMVMYIAELGFLFRIIQRRINENEGDDAGFVAKNMCSAISREMDAYYRSLVTLRTIEHEDDESDDEDGAGLTLRKIFVWSETEKPRLRWLARICDETRSLEGGQILAHLRVHRSSYLSPDIHDMMSRIVSSTAAPLNRMLQRWLTEGVLPDAHGEFFIMEDPKVAAAAAVAQLSDGAMMEEGGMLSGLAGGPNYGSSASNRIWWGLFKIRREMLPGGIDSSLAKKALIAGKSIAFLRRCCGDAAWIDRIHATDVTEIIGSGKRLLEADGKFDEDVVGKVIDHARRSASDRLKILFFDKFDLSHHFGAIKRYLLLSQGDFAQALMDGLAPILDGDGSILRNNLTSYVDAALQGASSFNEETDADILERLDVQIIEGNKDVLGWDAFMLTYRVKDAPLNTVFSEQVMEAYLLIFKFLWQLKRMDHLLSVSYMDLCEFDGRGRRSLAERRSSGFREVVKRAHFLRMKMTHLVQNMQHYCTVEVLEGSWTVLESDMAAAEDLDGLIQAHSKYLTIIKDRTLLSDRSAYVSRALREVLETIPAFHSAQKRLMLEGAEAVRSSLVEIDSRFDECFGRFLDALQRHSVFVDSCVFLVFRLDFNGHFKARQLALETAIKDLQLEDADGTDANGKAVSEMKTDVSPAVQGEQGKNL